MKTTKKGFTLIEIIVVIAIIGVLAVLLIPAMMGYMKKAKIATANEAAEVVMKAANSALSGLEEVECVFDVNATYHHTKMDGSYKTAGRPVENDADTLFTYMELYFDDVMKTDFSVYVDRGICVAASAASGNYYGTRPIVYTPRNYQDYDHTTGSDGALIDAVKMHKLYYPGVVDREGNITG